MKIIEINGCFECPYASLNMCGDYIQGKSCIHPSHDKYVSIYHVLYGDIYDKCPLKDISTENLGKEFEDTLYDNLWSLLRN